jgi:glucose/arabinose dehydrogenase
MSLVLLLFASAVGGGAQLADPGEYGPNPELLAPVDSLLPTLNIARQVGWPDDGKPIAAAGLTVIALARNLDHPRWLYVLPNGDVLVAESSAPPAVDPGVLDAIQGFVLGLLGAPAPRSANQITLLRTGQPGMAAQRHVFLRGLHSPFGMALIGHSFYVADTDAILRFVYHDGDTELRGAGVQVTALPGGHIIGHWTRSLLASPDGTKLYVGVGSAGNVGEDGPEADAERAAIWEVDAQTGQHRIFASGLRNPVGLAWEPHSGALWVSVNERDGLGDHVPPDYMTSVRDGGFYGYPFSYFGQHVDARAKSQDPAMVARAIAPDYALGAHTGSLGLCWVDALGLPPPFQYGMFVGQHGSWNRATRSGYRVVFVPFENGRPYGMPLEAVTGFLNTHGRAQGRPVGLAIDSQGALLVADDVGNTVWRVSAAVDRDESTGP